MISEENINDSGQPIAYPDEKCPWQLTWLTRIDEFQCPTWNQEIVYLKKTFKLKVKFNNTIRNVDVDRIIVFLKERLLSIVPLNDIHVMNNQIFCS